MTNKEYPPRIWVSETDHGERWWQAEDFEPSTEYVRADLGSFYQEKDIDALQSRIDALEAERDRLREAVDAIAPWLSASLSPKEEGGLGADAGSEYRAACDKVFRAALKGNTP